MFSITKIRINKAIEFAKQKHKNQKRKFQDEPYFNHPIRVVKILQNYSNEEDLIIAAYLHDTIEDTKTKFEEILELFGEKVAGLVLELTSDKKEAKKVGKAVYLANKVNEMSDEAFLIKLCDRLDNVSGFEHEPKDFVKRYRAETEYILKNIRKDLSAANKELIAKIREKIV